MFAEASPVGKAWEGSYGTLPAFFAVEGEGSAPLKHLWQDHGEGLAPFSPFCRAEGK